MLAAPGVVRGDITTAPQALRLPGFFLQGGMRFFFWCADVSQKAGGSSMLIPDRQLRIEACVALFVVCFFNCSRFF
jgi:hypothetical protein